MKNFLLKIVAFCLCGSGVVSAFGQEESAYRYMIESDDIRMSQRPGTEQLLRNYISPVLSGEDSVTVFFMIPTACPRCESIIKPAIERLKRVNGKERVLLVAWHPDVQATQTYLDRQHFGEDYRLVDSVGTFNDIFSTSMGTLQGLLIARIAVNEGRMVTGGDYTSVTEAFFRDFLAETKPLPFHVYDQEAVDFKREQRSEKTKVHTTEKLKYTAHELDTKGYFPGHLRNRPIVKGKELLMLDKMCNGALHLIEGGDGVYRMQNFIEVDSARRDTFVTLPPAEYNGYKSLFRYIPLDAIFAADGNVTMSYSLPNVFIQQSPLGTGEEVAFYNECAFLHYNEQGNKLKSFVKFANDNLEEWMECHFRIFPLRPGYITMSCQKMRWPIIDEKSEWGNPLTDPAMDGFYNQSNPYALEMELATGKITKRFGQLEDVFRQTRSGYWYSNLVADTHNGKFVYGNQLAGMLYLTADDAPEKTLKTYRVFDPGLPPKGDKALLEAHLDEYLLAFVPYFSKTIEQVTLDDKYINCLLRTGQPGKTDESDTYEFIKIARKTGKVDIRYELAPEHPDELLMAYGLTKNDSDNLPFYICKKQGRYVLKYIKP